MKSILLCEGETDQIILSYYFINQFAYSYDRVTSDKIKRNAKTGIPYSYIQRKKGRKEDNELVIWEVGGRDILPSALDQVLKQNRLNADRFYERIIVVADKDDGEESADFWSHINEIITKNITKASFAEEDWFKGQLACEFNTTRSVSFLMLNLPAEGNGALETFLLSALQEHGKAEKYIAQRAMAFVDRLAQNREKLENKYLHHRRLRTKAPLAVFFGITSPGRLFTEMNEMLLAVDWKNYKTIQKGFEKLDCFK